MGKLFFEYLEGNNIYCCNVCSVHLTNYNELVSKGFKGKTGKAYLFNVAQEQLKYFFCEVYIELECRVNVSCGPVEERILISGLHLVCDIYCKSCHTIVGWKYVN
eukprot:TRINITY_DN3212_c0_g1_i14.p3 TRINITY_DN3212_c0_g1~~TRINITY_DN3212_c0_g1_i14.p3  ORF type:complete len:105 (+),score=2.48 TRINITY_DN3212_c0_g1_i14:164-478(+)